MLFLISLLFSKNYEGYYLYKVYQPSTSLAQDLFEYDVWKADSHSIEVFMPTMDFDALNVPSSQYQVLKKDMNAEIEAESKRLERNNRFKRPAPVQPDDQWFEQFFVDYSPYDEVKQWYQKLADIFPDLVEFVPSIGKSTEGRDLFAIHLTSPSKQTKKQFYFESLIHAREWISGTTTAYITWQFIKGYKDQDPKYVSLLDRAEFVIVPIVNPDGYNYAHNSDRMWRKNRSSNKGGSKGYILII
eukprot:NODE_44_length_33449_cov_1.575742.p21 type:complete len:244 gc:universal NODE_44_length_33449_cov_1.575742:27289-26558(-)